MNRVIQASFDIQKQPSVPTPPIPSTTPTQPLTTPRPKVIQASLDIQKHKPFEIEANEWLDEYATNYNDYNDMLHPKLSDDDESAINTPQRPQPMQIDYPQLEYRRNEPHPPTLAVVGAEHQQGDECKECETALSAPAPRPLAQVPSPSLALPALPVSYPALPPPSLTLAPGALPAPHPYLALPAPRAQLTLPAPPSLALPAPQPYLALPTPRAQLALSALHSLALPTPRAQLALPAPRAQLALPTPRAQLALPAPGAQLALPAPHSLALPAPRALVPAPSPETSIYSHPSKSSKNNFQSYTSPHLLYICTRCNTHFKKESSLINHNKRFHAAFEQSKKGSKRKSKVAIEDEPLVKHSRHSRGEKRKYDAYYTEST